MKSKATKEVYLTRSLSLFDATAISVGAIIGAGIFVVTGIVAGLAGPALVISILVAGVVSLLTALSVAELAAKIPKEGGIYDYVYELISPFAGFLTGWMWLISNVFAGAAVSLGFGHYFAALFPFVSPKLSGVVLLFIFTLLNISGVRHSAELNDALVAIKLLVLGFFVTIGLTHVNTANLTPFAPDKAGIFYGAYFIFFAFGGFARVAVVAEEVKNPRKNVPKAILLSLTISAIIYLLVGFTAVGLAGAATLGHSSSPLADAINVTGISWAGALVSAGGLVATATVLLTTILGVSRMAYAMTEDGTLPAFLRKVHKKYDTPYYAILIAGIPMMLLMLFIDLTGVVAVSTLAMLFYYSLANVSAMRLKGSDRHYPRLVPLLGLVFCLTLALVILFKTPGVWATGSLILGVGSLYYRVRKTYFTRSQIR